ncbi:MAG: hypothetical protein RMJ87_07400 [Cytophagales bacterium]|nr:hypothetical protein [Bernardetiaceae bacterium]MDW8204838.1 hypothetical protein [Cytophagales bacterium]
MCNGKVLFHHALGFAAYCNQCRCVRFAFGTTAIYFTEHQFSLFCEYILDFYPHYNAASLMKNVWIPLGEQNTYLIISGKELHLLKKSLRRAISRLHVCQLIETACQQLN